MSRETVCGVFAAWSTLLAVYIPNFSPPVASGEPYHSEDQTCCETKARTCRAPILKNGLHGRRRLVLDGG